MKVLALRFYRQMKLEGNGVKAKINQTAVAIWLGVGVLMLIIQILLGGITRLTGSGLSITEWKPILGILPPLTEAAWQQSFQQYQQIAQFKKLNYDFILSDYKSIYFWEWLHREWARLMALVFVIPFACFVIKGKLKIAMIKPLFILFLLGGLQGFVGWAMVKSGLNETDVSVSHIRLAIHFMCAIILLMYLLWLLLTVSVPANQSYNDPALQLLNVLILLLLLFQLTYGAFMAGTHAALYAPTWPDINGAAMPADLFSNEPLWCNLLYNPIAIQFIHRLLAYSITVLVFIWYIQAAKVPHEFWLGKFRWVPLLLIVLQVMLGISSLKNSIDKTTLLLPILHQLVGILLLLTMSMSLNLCLSGRHQSTTTYLT